MNRGTPVVAAVTIGQSPRPDIVGDLAVLLPGIEWVESGALDGLDGGAIAQLAPGQGDLPLVTRACGQTVTVGERALEKHLQAAVDRVSARARAVVILCAGDLPPLHAPVPVVLPGRLLDGVAAALASGRRLNVMVPLDGQVDRQRQRWHARRVPVRVSVVAPYGETDFEAVGRLAAGTGDLTILDCIGYSCAQQQAIRRGAGHAVLGARGLAARVLAEMLR
jgi:protein AroM